MGLQEICDAAMASIESASTEAGVEVDQAIVILLSEGCVPNACTGYLAELDEADEEAARKVLGLLLSCASQLAERAGIRFAVANVGGDG